MIEVSYLPCRILYIDWLTDIMEPRCSHHWSIISNGLPRPHDTQPRSLRMRTKRSARCAKNRDCDAIPFKSAFSQISKGWVHKNHLKTHVFQVSQLDTTKFRWCNFDQTFKNMKDSKSIMHANFPQRPRSLIARQHNIIEVRTISHKTLESNDILKYYSNILDMYGPSSS